MSLYDSARDNLVKWHFKVNEPSKDLTIDKLKQKFYRADFVTFNTQVNQER